MRDAAKLLDGWPLAVLVWAVMFAILIPVIKAPRPKPQPTQLDRIEQALKDQAGFMARYIELQERRDRTQDKQIQAKRISPLLPEVR